ncbi:hypothetical protein KY335_05900 [Candidatus Woesearchaeota archaeon]|nr:hypothetical protein [Candidatus Woesearchaeota archaeon]
MKKGQVTVFIILGIIILVVFLFAFYLVARMRGEPMEEQQLLVAKSKLQSESLRYYVESCIKKASNDGIMLISNQGGYIFNEQPGSTLSCSTYSCTPRPAIEIEGWRTPYLITPNPLLVPQTYQYLKSPCAVNMSKPYCRYVYDPNITFEPFIGVSSLPVLSRFEGSSSIEEQLENYIAYKTSDCIDFGGVTNITGIPYIIQPEEPEVNISITSFDVRVLVKLPMKIVGEQAYPVVEVQDYEIILPVRYGHFYSFVRDLVNKEVADPGFDIADYDTLGTYWQGFSVYVAEDKVPGDDLIIVHDSQSHIGQKMLEFRFLRANLPPVLNYTRGASYSNTSEFIEYLTSDIQRLDVQPFAVDPNEDILSYSYGQWGQHFFEKFISTGQSQQLAIADSDKWMKPGYDAFIGSAYLMLNKSRDLGKHKFTIKAEDPTAMYDLQNVNISIWDAATFTGS